MKRFCIALLLIYSQSTILNASIKEIETMLVQGSKFLFQDQVGKKKLWHYNSRFKDDSQADCGVFNFEFCFYGRQDAMMSVLLKRNYSNKEISKIIHARDEGVEGISLDCTGFTKKECLRYSGHDLEIFIPSSSNYSFEELDDIARRNFDATRTWMTCEGLTISECKKLVIWDVQLDIPLSYSQKDIFSLINLTKHPERLYIKYNGKIKDAVRWLSLGSSIELPHALTKSEYRTITNNLEKNAHFRVLLTSMDMGVYTKGSAFYSGSFRWK